LPAKHLAVLEIDVSNNISIISAPFIIIVINILPVNPVFCRLRVYVVWRSDFLDHRRVAHSDFNSRFLERRPIHGTAAKQKRDENDSDHFFNFSPACRSSSPAASREVSNTTILFSKFAILFSCCWGWDGWT